MKSKAKNTAITFAKLPRDYAGLVGVLAPRPIRDKADMDNITEVINAMALHDKDLSADQNDYFEVLCQLVTAYEDEHETFPKRHSPRERLEFLLERHGMTGADLSRLLGGSRNLGAMILRGDREITAAHARTLGKHFAMPAGFFIE